MRKRAALVVVLSALAAGMLASSCTSVRNGLGTRESICFSALPAARTAVGSRPAFAGVRYLSPHFLAAALYRQSHEEVSLPPPVAQVARHQLCLVGYRGTMPRKLFATAWRPEPGPYRFAIVLVRQSDQKVLGVLVLDRPPVRFGHLS